MSLRNRGFKPPSISQIVDDIINEELYAELGVEIEKAMFDNVKIRMTHLETGVNCEFDMSEDIRPENVKAAIKSLMENGFVKTASGAATNKPDVSGKTGSIVSIEKVADKKQWKITVTLHEIGAGQIVFTAFEDKWRKGDRVRLSKNTSGYTDATLIADEDLDGKTQTDLPL